MNPTAPVAERPTRGAARAPGSPDRRRRAVSLGSLSGASTAIVVATALLFLFSWVVEPRSVVQSALLGMFPFAAILAIVAAGQTLVIQQGGIDLSVPGMISLTVVLVTRIPNGNSGKLGEAILIAFAALLVAGAITGFLVSRIGITAIVTTLGMNALLYGVDIQISGGTPRTTTSALQSFASGRVLGIPTTVPIAVVVTALVWFIVKKTVPGRRFEGVGASASGARAAGLVVARYRMSAYILAALMYCAGGVLLAGVVSTPSAFQGDTYLLPSVAAVVLGGTSLLGGRGSVVASAVAALFLTQLDQVLLTSGVSTALQSLINAVVLALGIAIYTIPWKRVIQWSREVRARPPATVAAKE